MIKMQKKNIDVQHSAQRVLFCTNIKTTRTYFNMQKCEEDAINSKLNQNNYMKTLKLPILSVPGPEKHKGSCYGISPACAIASTHALALIY